MRLLELFSVTVSVGNIAKGFGYELVSLDLKWADININILNWDFTEYHTGYSDVVWASPPCTEYSVAKTVGERKIEEANEIVLITLEIIEYLEPKYFIIENPQPGLLKKQWFMFGLPFDVFSYRKRTRLWNNVFGWKPRRLREGDCLSMDASGKRHVATAQRGPDKGKPNNKMKQRDLYRVPEPLIWEISKTYLVFETIF